MYMAIIIEFYLIFIKIDMVNTFIIPSSPQNNMQVKYDPSFKGEKQLWKPHSW